MKTNIMNVGVFVAVLLCVAGQAMSADDLAKDVNWLCRQSAKNVKTGRLVP